MAKGAVPLSLVYNQRSGFHLAKKETSVDQILAAWSQAGFEVQVFHFNLPQDIDQVMDQVLQRHLTQLNPGVVVAAGGDGTLNAVASRLIHREIPMGIIPMGTFNYVARVLNIPLNPLEAASVISKGHVQSVNVGRINQYIYLNNASLGLYPLFIKKREYYNQKFGRFSINAYTSGLDVLIRDWKELKLEIKIDQQLHRFRTPLIFFGNNQLQLAEMKLKIAECVKQGLVAGVVMAKSDKLTVFKTLFQLIKGGLEKAPDVYSFSAENVSVYSKKSLLTVAIDGEIVKIAPPLKIQVEKNALNVMVPYVDSSL